MERLGSLDVAFLDIEGPTSPMNIGSVAVFDGPAPSLDEVREFIDARLQVVPRCRQRVRSIWGDAVRPVWVDDEHFDVRDHVLEGRLPSGEPAALERFVERVMVDPLDRRRALWQMFVIDDLGDGTWAIVGKMHHCMVDGVAGTDLLSVLLDPALDSRLDASFESTARSQRWVPGAEPSGVRLAWSVGAASIGSIAAHVRRLVEMATHPRRSWRRLCDLALGARALWAQPSRRRSTLTGPIGTTRRWRHTAVPLAEVTAVRRALGGTVNDVVLTAVAHGFRELVRSRGEDAEGRDVMALVPVSTRSAAERGLMDNRVAVSHALLPIGIDDPVDTLAAIQRHLEEVKRSHQTDMSTVVLHSGDLTPHVVAARIARFVVRAQQNLETVATNVPGPREPLLLCGRRMRAGYPFAPIAGRIRIAVAIWSYCGTLFIGVTGDRDSTADLEVLVDGVQRGLRRLLVEAESLGTSHDAGPARQ